MLGIGARARVGILSESVLTDVVKHDCVYLHAVDAKKEIMIHKANAVSV